MKGQWLLAAHGPRVPKRRLPHQGYEEGREAMRKAEDYYDRLLECNGLRGENEQQR